MKKILSCRHMVKLLRLAEADAEARLRSGELRQSKGGFNGSIVRLLNCSIAIAGYGLATLLFGSMSLHLAQPVLAQTDTTSTTNSTSPFGAIENPLNKVSNNSYGDVDQQGAGLVGFISNAVKTITVVAGLYAMFNIVIAGVNYITSQGDPKGAEAARSKIKQSVIGLVIIASTFVLTAVAGRVLFGRYDAILNPTIYGPGAAAQTESQ